MSDSQTHLRTADTNRDQRLERRYLVEIRGEFRHDSCVHPVDIVELSGSGALVVIDVPPPVGEEAELWIEDFGTVSVKVIHSGQHSCGLAVIGGEGTLEELLDWALDNLAQSH